MSVMSKLVYGKLLQDLSALALDQQGLAGASGDGEATRKFRHGYFWGAAMRIAGGTDEILRNQIAERVLGLPGDIRVDKDVAFSKLASGR
jgi:alkylation response protein AidB-like acyl-CoA dehydrogenase